MDTCGGFFPTKNILYGFGGHSEAFTREDKDKQSVLVLYNQVKYFILQGLTLKGAGSP